MSIKYISKNKDGLWKIATTKTGKAIKTFETQKEAIAYAGTIKSTESILIKRESGWTVATGWDLNVAKAAKDVEKHSKAQGVTSKHAKATAVANATETPKAEQVEATPVAKTKTALSKVDASVEGKTSRKWLRITLAFTLIAVIAGVMIWWIFTKWK